MSLLRHTCNFFDRLRFTKKKKRITEKERQLFVLSGYAQFIYLLIKCQRPDDQLLKEKNSGYFPKRRSDKIIW